MEKISDRHSTAARNASLGEGRLAQTSSSPNAHILDAHDGTYSKGREHEEKSDKEACSRNARLTRGVRRAWH